MRMLVFRDALCMYHVHIYTYNYIFTCIHLFICKYLKLFCNRDLFLYHLIDIHLYKILSSTVRLCTKKARVVPPVCVCACVCVCVYVCVCVQMYVHLHTEDAYIQGGLLDANLAMDCI